MFIKLDVGICSGEVIEQNELMGKETIDDEDIVETEIRVNVDHIVDYERTAERSDQSEVEMITGSIIIAQNSPEQIDEKIENARYKQLIG